MNAPFRTPAGGRIDRNVTLTFTFDGRDLTGHPGDTLASALLANGVHQISTSIKLGRPRGITAAWAEDTGSLVQIEEPFPEPMLLATTIELFDGLVARGIPGQGRLAEIADSAQLRRHPRARRRAGGRCRTGRAGRRTDRGPRRRTGGARRRAERGRRRAARQHRRHRRRARPATGSRPRSPSWPPTPTCCTCSAPPPSGTTTTGSSWRWSGAPTTSAREAPAALSRQRVWRIRARHVVVATGAHERPVVFTDNDRPASCSPTAPAPSCTATASQVGEQAVVFTTNDSAYAAAIDLHDAGVRDHRHRRRPRRGAASAWQTECDRRGIPVRTGSVITGTRGAERITHALVSPHADHDQQLPLSCDVLLVSGGWNPAVHLFSQARGKLRYDDALGAFVPGEQLARRRASPAPPTACSTWPAACATAARPAPRRSANSASPPGIPIAGDDRGRRRVVAAPGAVAGARRGSTQTPSSSTCSATRRSPTSPARCGAGMRSMEHIKRYTTIGTAHDQGKTSGVIASGITAELLGLPGRRRSAPPRSGRPTRRWPSPRWPAAAAAACSTPNGSPRCTTGT